MTDEGLYENRADKSALKATAGVNRKSKRGIRFQIKRNSDSRETSEGARGNIQIGHRQGKIKNIRASVTKTIKKASVRRLVIQIIHRLIEGDMLCSLDGFRHRIIVEHIRERLGIAEEDTNASI